MTLSRPFPRFTGLLDFKCGVGTSIFADRPSSVKVISCRKNMTPRTNLVDVHMGRLRRKVDGSNEAPMIRNVRGVGFVLVGEAVRAGHPQFAVGQDREFGESDCKLGHAVQIEPGLWSLSPENGNISNIRRRLSAISLPQRPISEPGDR